MTLPTPLGSPTDPGAIPMSLTSKGAGVVSVDLRDLHAANIARQAEWCPDQVPDLSFRGNELAGETGEACNVIKKLERERQGWRGSRATKADLADELADVVICADLCAVTAGIDLGGAVVAKFNATSERQGLATRLPTDPASVSGQPAPVVPDELRALSEAATPGTLYTVDQPWGDGTWIVAGSPDPHAGYGVADCAGAFDREDEREDAPEAIREVSAADDAAFLAAAANHVRTLLATTPSRRADSGDVDAAERQHRAEIELQEIADGAYGDNPAVQGAARDRLSTSSGRADTPPSQAPDTLKRALELCFSNPDDDTYRQRAERLAWEYACSLVPPPSGRADTPPGGGGAVEDERVREWRKRAEVAEAQLAVKAAPQSPDGVRYQFREIGEGEGWIDCSREAYEGFASDPHIDTRAIEPARPAENETAEVPEIIAHVERTFGAKGVSDLVREAFKLAKHLDAVVVSKPAAPAAPEPAAGGERAPLLAQPDEEAKQRRQMELAVALTSGDTRRAQEIMNQAFYIDVCRAETRLKELVKLGFALLDKLPEHWHDDATINFRDIVESTDAVLAPVKYHKYFVENAIREYGAPTVVPEALSTPSEAGAAGEGFALREPVRKVTGDYQIDGIVVGHATMTTGARRYVVEHRAEGGGAFLHIYSAGNLESLAPPPTKPRADAPVGGDRHAD